MPSPDQGISRRELLKLIGVVTIGATLENFGIRKLFTGEKAHASHDNSEAALPESNTVLEVTSPEVALEFISIPYAPDTRTSFLPLDENTFEVYFSGGQDSYRAIWKWDTSSQTFMPLEEPQQIFRPSKEPSTEFGVEGYMGVSTVLSITTTDRVAFIHREIHPSEQEWFPFHAQITLAYSRDQGKTWEDIGPILTEKYEENQVSGVGQPSVIIKDGYVYCYYIHWSSTHDAIHLARCPVEEIGTTSAWQKWDGSAFTSSPEANSVAVTPPPEGHGYSALPCVSFNTYLNKYLMTFETNLGFCVSTSEDGVSWTPGELIMSNSSLLSERQNGDTWASYPSHFFPKNDEQGVLMYSSGVQAQSPHHPVMRTFQLK